MNALRLSTASFMRRSFSSVPAAAYLPASLVTERVLSTVGQVKACPTNLSADSYFTTDLGFDTLQRKELNQRLADEFRVRLDAKTGDGFVSVQDAVKYFSAHPKAR